MGIAELREALVGDELEVGTSVGEAHAGHALAEHVGGEQVLAVDRLVEHRADVGFEFGVEQFGLLLAHGVDHFEREVHVAALVAEHPVGAVGKAVQETLRAQEVHVGERREEEQALDARREADQVEQELLALFGCLDLLQALDRVDPLEAELGLGADRRDVLDGGERRFPLGHVGDVVVEQREVELHVQRLFVELARQVHPCFGGVDVLVQVEHQVVRHDGVAGGEERHQSPDEVLLGGHQLALQVDEVVGEVDLLDGPGVLDRIAVHVEELRVPHRPQRQVVARVEDVGRTVRADRRGRLELVGEGFTRRGRGIVGDRVDEGHQSHASHASGFSRLHAIASSSV